MRIVCLSGWAQPADALEDIAPGAAHVEYAGQSSPQDVLGYLQAHYPEADMIIGWSLGGQLALRALAEGAMRAKALVTIGTPAQYLQSEHFAHGMGRSTYTMFRDNYHKDAVRTSRRFAALIAKGDRHERHIARLLEPHNAVGRDAARWLPWLEDMAARPLHDAQALLHLPPALILHGKEDAIVSHRQAEALHAILPEARLELLETCGHAPHLHDAPRIKRLIEEHAARHVL